MRTLKSREGSDWPKSSCLAIGRADSELSHQVPSPGSAYPLAIPDPHWVSQTLKRIDGDSLCPLSYELLLSLLAGLILAPQGEMADAEKASEREPLWASAQDQEEMLWKSI